MSSVPAALPTERSLPLRRRALPMLAVGASCLAVRLRPVRLRRALEFARRRAAPATTAEAVAAWQDVVAVSTRRAAASGLRRSVAIALLCRARGVWPTWCTGVRTDPFAAHAWLEVDGHPIGEPTPSECYRRLVSVPPL